MNLVFADTSYFLALMNRHDALHDRANEFAVSNNDHILTTTWVVTEVADGIAKSHRRRTFADFWEHLNEDRNTTLIRFSDELFEKGIDLYNDRPDKQWSLTDCISFVVMEQHGLREALTGDHHFTQAGFVALLA